ncbi:hypothetical protein [Rhodococcus qingshengii]|nr:hypothetical protein [Rhodococcus qingshengii]
MSSNETQNLRVVLDTLDAFFAGGAEDIESLDELRDKVRTKLVSSD